MAAATCKNMSSFTSDASWDLTVQLVNKEFGDDIKSLEKAKLLLDQVKETKASLEEQLSYATNEVPGKIDLALKDAEDTTKQISTFSVEQEQLSGDISNHLADVRPMAKTLSKLISQINQLQTYAQYLQMIGRIEDLSSDIQSALIIDAVERAVTQFSEMADLVKCIQTSKCENLVKFANDTVNFWYRILKEKLATEFDEILKAYQWPFIMSTVRPKAMPNAAELKAKLPQVFRYLLHLQLPEGLSREGHPNHPFLASLPGWRPLLLPLQLMILPLRKRFRYHFYGQKQTNSLDKPEWYLTSIITWIKDHLDFLNTKIQPLLDKAGLQYVDAVVEFTRGLVLLSMEKLLHDIPDLLYDEQLFSHMIDETLAFDRELRSGYGYPTSQLGVLNVLTQEEPFLKWIHIERKYAFEKMDAMFEAETAWLAEYKDISIDIDDMKVPECGEGFMTLMTTITERYKPLPHMNHKLKFLQLQLELLDDFRIRLLQIKNGEANMPLNQIFCAILNTVSYVSEVLREWSELVFFLQLQYHKSLEQRKDAEEILSIDGETPEHKRARKNSPDSDSQKSVSMLDDVDLPVLEGTLFEEMIQLYDLMKNDMLNTLIRYVTDDIKARSRPYRKDKWLALPSQREGLSLGLSSSACEMMIVCKDHLHDMQGKLSKPMFSVFWQRVAFDINNFIYRELILQNHFNEGGALQLNFDMTRNLFPLFGQYTQKPENYFKDVKEACILLTMNVGSALLLKNVLYQALHASTSDGSSLTDPIATLQEMSIYKLTPEEVELVLSLRTNLTPT